MRNSDIVFPKGRIGQMAIDSPVGRGRIYRGNRCYPRIGVLCQEVPWCKFEDGTLYDPFNLIGTLPGPSGRINILERARSLVGFLRNFGVEGIIHPDIYIECEDEAGLDYAILGNAFSPWGNDVDGPYFDQDFCILDFKETVRSHFKCDPSVRVEFLNVPYGSNEIELTRI